MDPWLIPWERTLIGEKANWASVGMLTVVLIHYSSIMSFDSEGWGHAGLTECDWISSKKRSSKLYPLRCLPQYAPLLTAPCLSSYSDQPWLFLCMLVIPPLVQIPSIRVSGERWQRSHPFSIYPVIMRPFNRKARICKHESADCSLTLYSFVS